MDESELNAIRAARLAELQKGQARDAGAPQDEQKSAVLAQLVEPGARERLARVRMVRPERADQVEQYLVKMAATGSLTRKVGEKDVVEILESLARDEKKQSKIVFERKGGAGGAEDEDDDFFD